MPATRLSLNGVAKVKLYDAIMGRALPGGVTVSKTYPGLITGNGCQFIQIESDDANLAADLAFIGDDSGVSDTNFGQKLAPGEKYTREVANGYNNIALNTIWLTAAAGTTPEINVIWEYA